MSEEGAFDNLGLSPTLAMVPVLVLVGPIIITSGKIFPVPDSLPITLMVVPGAAFACSSSMSIMAIFRCNASTESLRLSTTLARLSMLDSPVIGEVEVEEQHVIEVSTVGTIGFVEGGGGGKNTAGRSEVRGDGNIDVCNFDVGVGGRGVVGGGDVRAERGGGERLDIVVCPTLILGLMDNDDGVR